MVLDLRKCRPLQAIHFFGRQTQPTPARSETLLKARTIPSNFSFKTVPVSLNCFHPCQIDLTLPRFRSLRHVEKCIERQQRTGTLQIT